MMNFKEYFLALLVTLSVFTTDLYLSSFKELKSVFACQFADMQWSIFSYLIGFAFSIPLCGILSESIGRKKTILLGLILYFFSSLACIGAKTLFIFSCGRFFQAFGGCATSIVSRIIVRDIYLDSRATNLLSNMFIAVAIVLLTAPIVGGVIQDNIGWMGHFIFMGGYSFLLFVFSLFFLEESSTSKLSILASFDDFKIKTKEVFLIPDYRRYVSLIVVLWVSFFSFISGSSLLFLEYFERSPTEFGLIYAIIMFGFILGNFIAKKNEKFLFIGISFISCASMFFMSILWFNNLYICIFLTFVYMFGIGIVLPIAQAKATKDIQRQISVGFSWMYCIKMFFAAAGGLFVYIFSSIPKTTFLLMSFMGALQLYIYIVKIKSKAQLLTLN